ncbi:MAG: hypothetical protein Kow0074_01860 [Candidatus Zixiibacteriota bacterium]
MADANTVEQSRSQRLADRLERGANALAALAEGLTDAEWNMAVEGDGRTVGTVIHHVASVYPVEVELARTLASGNKIEGVTMEGINKMNADHAHQHTTVDKKTTIELLKANSMAASAAIRGFTDAELDNAAPISLYSDAPLTAQFFIEDHALRHSYHHLARIRETLKGKAALHE